jgi:hypothetical protein
VSQGVPTYEFPALGFDPAPGDPAAVSAGADASRGFAQRLAGDVATLNRMTADSWVGEAGDAFREKIKDLPRDLDRSRAAHEATGAALAGYASALDSGQRRARTLEQEAAEALRQQQAAMAQADSIRGRLSSADASTRPNLESQARDATGRAGQYGDRLAAIRAEAQRLQSALAAEADRAAGRIRAAADAPYEEPSWWQKAWDGFMDWVRDNADVLKTISGVLKIVSAVCAVLSFIPVVGVFFGALALTAGAVSLLIDVAVKLATGEGSWGGIALDAVLTLVPGGKLTKMLGAPLAAGGRLLGRAAPGLTRPITAGARTASHAVQQGVFQLSRLAPSTRAFERLAGHVNNLPAAVGRWTVGHRPQAVVTRAERTFDDLIRGGMSPEEAWRSLGSGRDLIRSVQRDRFWSNVRHGLDNDADFAARYSDLFSDADRALLANGRAPQHFDPVTRTQMPVQLSHEPTPISSGGGAQIPRQAWQHAAYDPTGWRYPNDAYLNDWLRTGRLSPIPDDFLPFGGDQRQPSPVPAR